MHIIRLWVQVWQGGARTDIDQDSLALSTRRRGRALGHRQEVHQLFTQFDSSTDQGGAVGRIKAWGYRFPVDRVQFALGAQHHSTRERKPRSSKNPLIPAFPPGQALRTEIWSN